MSAPPPTQSNAGGLSCVSFLPCCIQTQSQMDLAQSHLGEVHKQKQIIHERLQSNRDCINELQREISRVIGAAGVCELVIVVCVSVCVSDLWCVC